MIETNVTRKRTHQVGRTLLALLPSIPLPKTPLVEIHYPKDKKKAVQGLKLPSIALIQIGSGYSGGSDEDILSS
jgi:hypothetical protein